MVRRLGVPALGLGPVRDHDYVVARGRLTLPAVRQVEQVAAITIVPIDSHIGRTYSADARETLKAFPAPE
jgi:hypothetical protein